MCPITRRVVLLILTGLSVSGPSRAAEDPGPPPGPGYFHVPGYYEPSDPQATRPVSGPKDTAGLTWHPGFWARVQPGWTWRPAGWTRQGDVWRFRPGSWIPEPLPAPSRAIAGRHDAPTSGTSSSSASGEADAIIREAHERAARNPHPMTDAERAALFRSVSASRSAITPASETAAAALNSMIGHTPPNAPAPILNTVLPPPSTSNFLNLQVPQFTHTRGPSAGVYLGNSAPGSTYESYLPTPNHLGNSVYVGQSAPGSSFASYSQTPTPLGNSYYAGASVPGVTYGTYLPSAASSIGNYGYGPVAPGLGAGGQVGIHP